MLSLPSNTDLPSGVFEERSSEIRVLHVDDGPGIPEERRDAVFETGETTTADGNGLGLAIVSEFAGAHDWDVLLTESEAGGVRFEFTNVEMA